jgi:FAD-linked sulfhydryl oxidase
MMKSVPKKKTQAAAAPVTTAPPSGTPDDCPPDVETLGRSTWTLLHTMAATYPEKPSPSQQSDMLSFVGLFSRLYPCWVCAEDFQTYIKREQPRVGGRGEFGLWMCNAHNEVNQKLGKPVFDCSRWEERWRTGWKDGRCD